MPSKLLAKLQADRDQVSADMTALLGKVEERALSGEDDHLTDAETKNLDDLKASAASLDDRIADLVEIEQRQAAAAATALTIAGIGQVERNGATGRATGGAKVKSEPTTYHQRSTNSWVLDSIVAGGLMKGLNSVDAAEAQARLERHAQEVDVMLEERDSTTTTFGGLVPPLYLVDQFAPNLRAGRPYANLCQGMGLPGTGMSVIIPRATGSTTVSTQATQNTAPTTTDMAITDLSVSIITFQGRGVISRQALERGAVGLDTIVFNDLAADAARYIDQQALYGTGAGGNALGTINTGGIISVAITGTTGLDLIKAIANALQSINTQRFVPANVIVMHPRRWGALTIATDTANRPLVTVEAGSLNIFGQGEAAATQQVVGTVLGVPVVTDPNLRTNLGAGTNQDEVLVVRREDQFLWEKPLETFNFEQPVGPQSVQLAVYGNAAFSSGRYPTSVAYISGAGLVPPTF